MESGIARHLWTTSFSEEALNEVEDSRKQRTSLSARRGQAQQGGQCNMQTARRSGTNPPAKASADKNPNSLAIEPHKIRSMPANEPMSPKITSKRPQVWGPNAHRTRTLKLLAPTSMQLRIEQKRPKMFVKSSNAKTESSTESTSVPSIRRGGSLCSDDSW